MVSLDGSSLLVKDGWTVVVLIRSARQPLEKSQVIKHIDVMYCIVMSCVGGEVTSPYGTIMGMGFLWGEVV